MARFNIPEREWDIAEQLLESAANGTKLPYSMSNESGQLVPRKRYRDKPKPYQTTYSFIKINGTIYALAQGKKRDALIRKGSCANLKFACNRSGENLLIKKGGNISTSEVEIMMDLSQSYGFEESTDRSKLYVTAVFLGTDLKDFLDKNHKTLSDDERFNIAIQLCWKVFSLHQGLGSKTGTAYAHGDLKHDNITIDQNGYIHIIDYGHAEKYPYELGRVKSDAAAYMPYIDGTKITKEQIDIVSLKRTLFAPESYYAPKSLLCSSGFYHEDVDSLHCFRILTQEMLDRFKLSDFINTFSTEGQLPDYGKKHIHANTLCAILIAAKLNLKISYDEIVNNLDLATTIGSLYMSGRISEIETIIASEEDVILIGTLQETNRLNKLQEYKFRVDFLNLMLMADSRQKRAALVYVDELGFCEISESLIHSSTVTEAVINVKNFITDSTLAKNYIEKVLSDTDYAATFNFLTQVYKYKFIRLGMLELEKPKKEQKIRKLYERVMDNEESVRLIASLKDEDIKKSIRVYLRQTAKPNYEDLLVLSVDKSLANIIVSHKNYPGIAVWALKNPEAIVKGQENCHIANLKESEHLRFLLSNDKLNALNILVESKVHERYDLSSFSSGDFGKISPLIIKLQALHLDIFYERVLSQGTDGFNTTLAQVLESPFINEITSDMIANEHMLKALFNANNDTENTKILFLLFKLNLIGADTFKSIHSSPELRDIILLLHQLKLDEYIHFCLNSSIKFDRLKRTLTETSDMDEAAFIMRNISFFKSDEVNNVTLNAIQAYTALDKAGVELDINQLHSPQIQAINKLNINGSADKKIIELVINKPSFMEAINQSTETYQIKALLVPIEYDNEDILNKLLVNSRDSLLSKMLYTSRDNIEAELLVSLYEQIERLKQKEKDFITRNETKAMNACHDVIENLEFHLNSFFDPEKDGSEHKHDRYIALKEDCSNAIFESRKVLEKHRGICGIFDKLLTILASLIIFYPVVYAYQKYNGINYSFFKTDSTKMIDDLDQVFKKMKP